MNTIDSIRELEREISDINRRLIGVRKSFGSITAADIPIVDAGDFYRATEVEAALQEEAAIVELTNGTVLRPIALSVAAAGGVITASLSSLVGNTITFVFSDGLIDVDVTAPMTAVLTAGTDIDQVMNYLYVLKTDPTTLVSANYGIKEEGILFLKQPSDIASTVVYINYFIEIQSMVNMRTPPYFMLITWLLL